MATARQMAAEALLRVDKDGAYSNLALDRRLEEYERNAGKEKDTPSQVERRKSEAAFASTLFYGVLERRLTLDCCIEKYAAKGLKGMSPEVLQILRVAFYQLLFLPNIPESAVVNEAVKITKQMRRSSASGFVNGILRSFLRDDRALPHFDNPLKELSILYSIPEWMLLEWQKAYGFDNTEQMASAFNRPSPLFIRANSLKGSSSELCEKLKEEQVSVFPDPDIPGCIRIAEQGNLRKLSAFQNGLFHVQDKSSQLCALALGAEPGEHILDICAAPGGKTFTIAQQMQDKGVINACDLYEKRVGLIREGAERLGIASVCCETRDALQFVSDSPLYDRVLCDAPCSGLGVLGRKPEIRYKQRAECSDLPFIQYKILETAARYLKKGGVLVYSTCTLRPVENSGVVRLFLKKHPSFVITPFPEGCGSYTGRHGELTLMPHVDGTDGFYICRMMKQPSVKL